jgi:FK506-binding protein 2
MNLFYIFLFLAIQHSHASCKPRNRDLHPDSRLNIGILHRPADCDTNSKGKIHTGDDIVVHYEAHLFRDCRKIDSSRDKGEPYKFKVGDGTTIKGWERGLLGMCVGERRKLIVPSGLAYGMNGVDGTIPKDATILYDIERMP